MHGGWELQNTKDLEITAAAVEGDGRAVEYSNGLRNRQRAF